MLLKGEEAGHTKIDEIELEIGKGKSFSWGGRGKTLASRAALFRCFNPVLGAIIA